MDDRVLHAHMNCLKYLVAVEYVLLVDSAVELQKSFHRISAKCPSPIVSPKRKILFNRPGVQYKNSRQKQKLKKSYELNIVSISIRSILITFLILVELFTT